MSNTIPYTADQSREMKERNESMFGKNFSQCMTMPGKSREDCSEFHHGLKRSETGGKRRRRRKSRRSRKSKRKSRRKKRKSKKRKTRRRRRRRK